MSSSNWHHSIPYFWFMRKLVKNHRYLASHTFSTDWNYYCNNKSADSIAAWEQRKKRQWISHVGTQNVDNVKEVCTAFAGQIASLDAYVQGSSVYGKPTLKDIDIKFFKRTGIQEADMNLLELNMDSEFHRQTANVLIYNVFPSKGTKIQIIAGKKPYDPHRYVTVGRHVCLPYVKVMAQGVLHL